MKHKPSTTFALVAPRRVDTNLLATTIIDHTLIAVFSGLKYLTDRRTRKIFNFFPSIFLEAFGFTKINFCQPVT